MIFARILPVLFICCCCLPDLAAQKSNATYYAKRLYGRLTSTGETLDSTRYTAASKTYDWGTILEVTNKLNGRQVRVRVNDCGPHPAGNVLDLSQVAARELRMVKRGKVPVSIRVVRASTAGPTCHRDVWAKRLRAAGRPIPPPPPEWEPGDTAGSQIP